VLAEFELMPTAALDDFHKCRSRTAETARSSQIVRRKRVAGPDRTPAYGR
jgi:hypothetical protein